MFAIFILDHVLETATLYAFYFDRAHADKECEILNRTRATDHDRDFVVKPMGEDR